MKRVCVYCGSNCGARAVYAQAAHELAQTFLQEGMGLVFGGGRVGLMGRLADAMLAGGGEVIGVIPQALVARELAHPGVPTMHVVGSMHERKALMADLADAFIALPGGYGTFEEFCETLTWAQLGLHAKPCGVLNTDGFFDPLLAMFDHAVAERFIVPEHRRLLVVDSDPRRLVAQLRTHRPPQVEKWIDREQS